MGLGNQSRPRRALFDVSTATTTAIVAAITDKRIVVTNLVITIASGQTIVWQSATTDISGEIPESYSTGDNELGILETVAGEALQLVTSAAAQASGHLTYVVLP